MPGGAAKVVRIRRAAVDVARLVRLPTAALSYLYEKIFSLQFVSPAL